MKKLCSSSETKALLVLTAMYRDFCGSWAKGFEGSNVKNLYDFAKSDIEAGHFTWESFFEGFRLAVKNNEYPYPPSYKTIKEHVRIFNAKRPVSKNKELLPPELPRSVVMAHYRAIGETLGRRERQVVV